MIVNGAQIFTGLTRAPGNPIARRTTRPMRGSCGGRAAARRRRRRTWSRRRRCGGGGAAAGGAVAAAGRRGATPPAAGAAGAAGARRLGVPAAADAAAIANVGPSQCHDITLYPGMGLGGGACGGYGLLLDIREPAHPVRMDFVGDPNMAFWHSATFSNDGNKVLFSDEWGGGGGPKCRAKDCREWGGNALFTIEKSKLVFHSYYKIPAPRRTPRTASRTTDRSSRSRAAT